MKHSLNLKNLKGCTLNKLEKKKQKKNGPLEGWWPRYYFTLAKGGVGNVSPKKYYSEAESHTI